MLNATMTILNDTDPLLDLYNNTDEVAYSHNPHGVAHRYCNGSGIPYRRVFCVEFTGWDANDETEDNEDRIFWALYEANGYDRRDILNGTDGVIYRYR